MRENFENKYTINERTGCWEWIRALDKDGYGCFSVRGEKTCRAHRWSYRIFVGEIIDGLNVLHTCDNRKCVNPEHLFLGTHKDNMNDAQSKGRLPTAVHPSYTTYVKGCRCDQCLVKAREYTQGQGKIAYHKYREKPETRRQQVINSANYKSKNVDKVKQYQRNYYLSRRHIKENSSQNANSVN